MQLASVCIRDVLEGLVVHLVVELGLLPIPTVKRSPFPIEINVILRDILRYVLLVRAERIPDVCVPKSFRIICI